MTVSYGVTKAYTTIELLLALLVTIIIITPLNILLSNLHHLKYNSLSVMEDNISLQQLRLYLAETTNFSIENNCLIYDKANEEKQLCLVNKKIISQPGTLVFFANIDNISFFIDSNIVYLEYCRGDNCYEKWLALY